MKVTFDTTIAGGLPVTVRLTYYKADRDVGEPEGFDDLEFVAVGGKPVKRTEWLFKRLTHRDETRILGEAYYK